MKEKITKFLEMYGNAVTKELTHLTIFDIMITLVVVIFSYLVVDIMWGFVGKLFKKIGNFMIRS